jgi:hypothetical protein
MNTSMNRGIIAVLAVWLAASACQFLTGAPQVATVPPQDIAYTAAALALTAQASAIPLPTVETAPQPTEVVETETPAGDKWQWFPSMDSHCRSGPGIQYESLTVLWPGQRLAALGTDESGNWIQVRMQLSTNTCWTRAETGNLSGDASALPVVSIANPVPTATLPKPVASGSDIDVLRVGASQQEGRATVYMDIRNNGPDDFSGLVRLVCTGQSKMRDKPYTQDRITQEDYVDLTIYDRSTGTINSSMETDTASYSYPTIQCTITVPNKLDPNPDNNIGATAIP